MIRQRTAVAFAGKKHETSFNSIELVLITLTNVILNTYLAVFCVYNQVGFERNLIFKLLLWLNHLLFMWKTKYRRIALKLAVTIIGRKFVTYIPAEHCKGNLQ